MSEAASIGDLELAALISSRICHDVISPVGAIVDYARDRGIDLIVMGTHGRGPLKQFMVGSVAERVVRTAPCPVLTVRHPEREFIRPDTLMVAANA